MFSSKVDSGNTLKWRDCLSAPLAASSAAATFSCSSSPRLTPLGSPVVPEV